MLDDGDDVVHAFAYLKIRNDERFDAAHFFRVMRNDFQRCGRVRLEINFFCACSFV